MLRIRKELGSGSDLDDLALPHHREPVADLCCDLQIMGDEEHGEVQLVLEAGQELQYLRLHRHVQRRYGFVGDQHVRIERESAGDADTLALSAGEFMRQPICGLSRKADKREQLSGLGQGVLAPHPARHRSIGNGKSDFPPGVGRREGILKNHLNLAAPPAQLFALHGRKILTIEQDRDGNIIVSHVLPNVVTPVVVQATITMAVAILAEASLAFLGLGQRPPAASWGSMLDVARQFMGEAPWMSVWPGLAIVTIVLGFNLLGDGLNDALNRQED